ncbi:MAG: hypothetical protein AAFV53_05465 [Myxococcota bacterium]
MQACNPIAAKILRQSAADAEASLKDMIADLDGTVRERASNYIEEKLHAIKELADSMKDEDMEADLYRSLSLLWLELQMEWQRYNDVMSYQMFNGEADPFIVISGSLVSGVQQAITASLSEEDVTRLYSLYEESAAVD